MAGATRSLLLIVVCAVATTSAGRVSSSFYPVHDDQYPAHSGPIAVHKTYGDEKAYGGFQDGGHRATGAGYGGGVQEADYYADSGKVGNSGHKSAIGFDHNQKSEHKNQDDQGYYGDVSGVKSAYDDGRSYQGAQNYGQKGHNVQNTGTRGGHKKGHHTTGFTNSYHKEENGKKSEFYDSLNDEGDHYNTKGQEQAYAGQNADAYKGGHQDSAFRTDARGKQGHYGAGSSLEDSQGHKGDYGRQDFYDRQAGYGQKAAHDANRQGGGYYGGGAKHNAGGGHATAGFYGGAGAGHHAGGTYY